MNFQNGKNQIKSNAVKIESSNHRRQVAGQHSNQAKLNLIINNKRNYKTVCLHNIV